jgi:hypothetical protein
MFFRGDDVHAYTTELRNQLLLVDKEVLQVWKTPSTMQETIAVVDKLVEGGYCCIALKKIRGHLNLFDPELGIYVLPLLKTVAGLVTEDTRVIFKQILEEMGSTCVQGDTHRLLSLFFALGS